MYNSVSIVTIKITLTPFKQCVSTSIYYDQFTVCDQLQHSSSSRVTLYLPVPIINIKFYKKCKNSNSTVSLFLMKLGIDGDPIFIDLVVPDN